MSRRLLVTILGLVMCVGCTPRLPILIDEGEPDLSEQIKVLVHKLQESLTEAQKHDPKGFPKLLSASVTIQTVAATTRYGKLSYVVASIDRKKKAEHTSSLTLKLVIPEPLTAGGPEVAIEALEDALANAIHNAKRALLVPLKAEPKLVADTVRVDVKFNVSWSAGVEIDSLKLLPIGVKGSVQREQSQTHVIQLEFGKAAGSVAQAQQAGE